MRKDREIVVRYPNNPIMKVFKKLFGIYGFEMTATYTERLRLEFKEKHGINLKKEVLAALKNEYEEELIRQTEETTEWKLTQKY